MLVLYREEKFDGLYLNGRMLPLGTYGVANKVIIATLCMNFAGLISTVVLCFVNQRRQIRWWLHSLHYMELIVFSLLSRTTLSSKFQSVENRVTSHLLFWVSSVQFTAFVLTDVATLAVRIFLSGSILATAFKENADVRVRLSHTAVFTPMKRFLKMQLFQLFNIYTLVLPILTTVHLAKVKKRRIIAFRHKVNVRIFFR